MQFIIKILIPLIVTWKFSQAYQEEVSVLDNYLPILRLVRRWLSNQLEAISQTKSNRQLLASNRKLQEIPANFQFPCNLNMTLRSKDRPRSVHKIRPGDIDVIGAIGDSLTAGFGTEADDVVVLFHEGRGSSFPIGGAGTWKSYLTLPNILKIYNPKIYGYSLNSLSIDRNSKFNVAEVAAISKNMPYMAKVLVKRIRNDRKVDLKKDWKMITVFIGHNDFCSDVCYQKDFNRVLLNHKNDMVNVLRIFRDNLPRTIINFIPPIHLRVLTTMNNVPEFCRLAHIVSCPCLFGLPNRNLRTKMMDFMTRWQELDIEVANYREFDREDFTVIAHEFTTNLVIPPLNDGKTDYGYFAPDCFHASQKGHAKAANDLWNSLLEPYGNKTHSSTDREFGRFLCPTKQHPFIFTKKNSIYNATDSERK